MEANLVHPLNVEPNDVAEAQFANRSDGMVVKASLFAPQYEPLTSLNDGVEPEFEYAPKDPIKEVAFVL